MCTADVAIPKDENLNRTPFRPVGPVRSETDSSSLCSQPHHALDELCRVERVRAGARLGEPEPADADGGRGDLMRGVLGQRSDGCIALKNAMERVGRMQRRMPEIEGRLGPADLAEVDDAGVAA